MEHQVTGRVTKTSSDSCDISVCIGGTTKHLSFGRRVFYTFGLRCDGNLDNILDEGMEVEVCYTISQSGDPCIVAVWLGHRPESFGDDEYSGVSGEAATRGVYGVVGRIIAKDGDTFLVQADKYKVSVRKDVVFRDGRRLDHHSSLDVDEEVTFDAVPCKADPLQATCVWSGRQPSVVDRFHLDSIESNKDMELEILQRHEVHGTVVVIPNEVLALVEVDMKSMLFTIMLFRNSFKPPCERIQDVVSVGDSLLMRLRYGCVFSDCRWWFAAKAVKGSSSGFDSDVSCEGGSSVANGTSTDDAVLYSSTPLLGTISPLSCDSACITYKDFKIFVDKDSFYFNNRKCSVRNDMLSVFRNKTTVKFEAIPTELPGFTHESTCAWVGNKRPKWTTDYSSLPPPKLSLLGERGQVFYGFVSKLWLPDVAFVEIPDEATVVSIGILNISGKPKYGTGTTPRMITDFVRLNDIVKFKLWKVSENAVIGWDVGVLPFSRDDWVNENGGIFVSRGPRENLEDFSFTENAIGDDYVSYDPLKKRQEKGFPVGKPRVCGSTEATDDQAAGSKQERCSLKNTRFARWNAKKIAQMLRGNTPESRPSEKQSCQRNAIAGGSCEYSDATTAAPNGRLLRNQVRVARWRAKKVAEGLLKMPISKDRAGVVPASASLEHQHTPALNVPEGEDANPVAAKNAARKSTVRSRACWNSAEKVRWTGTASRAALTNRITGGVACISISTKVAGPRGKPTARGNFLGNPQGKAKGQGNNQTVKMQSSKKVVVEKNAGRNVPLNTVCLKAAVRSSKMKPATGSAFSENAAAKKSPAQNAKLQSAGSHKSEGKSSAAKSRAANEAAVKGSL